jgi:methylglyoxal synthase
MQKHGLSNRSDTATFDRGRLTGCKGDPGAHNPERPLLHPLTGLIPSRKRIALVAHDNRKERLACWALKHRSRLIDHELYATSYTADIISEALNAPVFRLLSGPLGGDQQIGSRIAESKIDVLIFFWDPLGHQPHDSDVNALLRLATAYNIPNAYNEATADCIISSSLLLDAEPQAVSESPNHNLLTVKEAADYLRLPLSSLYYLVQRGQIPAIQIGGRWRIKKSSLDGHVLGAKTQKCKAALLQPTAAQDNSGFGHGIE